jgi:hypothetical protein
MKIIYIINVDFALVHFLLPLMREARARGHEVAAICAEGPLLAAARAEGFRILPAPLIRRLAPAAGGPSAPMRGHARAQEPLPSIALHQHHPQPGQRRLSQTRGQSPRRHR